jgi:hypothetical protein
VPRMWTKPLSVFLGSNAQVMVYLLVALMIWITAFTNRPTICSGEGSTRIGGAGTPVDGGPTLRAVARDGLPPLQPDLKLDDTIPFRLSRNHFMIEKRDGSYCVRDLSSTLGTIVNGEPIGEHFRSDDAPLRAGENEVIAGGVDLGFDASAARTGFTITRLRRTAWLGI